MLFPTAEFSIFFLLVFLFSWLTVKYPVLRKSILVAASYTFYGLWNTDFTLLLLLYSLTSFIFGYYIGKAEEEIRRKFYLILGLILNLGILGYFKYYNFFVDSLNDSLNYLNINVSLNLLEILLPIGISFYTFQAISYLIDVYREDIKHSDSLLEVVLYISFFPQLFSGPIIKAENFFNNLLDKHDINKIDASRAFGLILSGLFKKLIVANYIGEKLVNPVYSDLSSATSIDMFLTIVGYSVQIYCDFSAYSDFAIAVAVLLGFNYPTNFNQPYRALTVQDFWKRWHISLSSWLMDYLFKPLQISLRNHKNAGTAAALIITFLLCGLWHGASLTFVFWGLLNGAAIAVERFSLKINKDSITSPLERFYATAITFSFISLSWIFFRAENFTVVGDVFSALFSFNFSSTIATPFIVVLILLGIFINFIPLELGEKVKERFTILPMPIQGLVLALVFLIITAMGPEGIASFIYFNF